MQTSQPYTYRITHLPSGKHYYGARYAKGCHPSDLWVKYFTSSKTVKNLIKQDGKDAFFVEVRRLFNDKELCVEWERKVLVKLGVPRNEAWLNKHSGVSLTPDEMKKAMVDKYGYDHPSKIPEIVERKRLKSLARYGVDYPWLSDIVKTSRITTLKERYGFENPSQVPEFKARIAKGISDSYKSKVDVVCPKCGYFCKSEANMIRYHFDNCKHYEIRTYHDQGLSPTEIQNLVGLDRHSVTKYLKFFGIKSNLPKAKTVVENAKNMVNLSYSGVFFRSVSSLAKHLGVGRKKVDGMIKRGEVVVLKPCQSKTLDNPK